MTDSGYFIAFEGGDGAGKSTQVRHLVAALEAAGREVVVTRQPGGTALGAALRDLVLHGEAITPRAEALVFAADKAQHVAEVVLPSLARGAVVVTDRYVDSSVAYQGAGRSLGVDEVAQLQGWAVGGLTPDLTVVEWPDGGDANHEEPACGAHYQPYGPVELAYVTAMIAEVAAPAASVDSNPARKVCTDSALRNSFTVTSVVTPSVPSDPTNVPSRS